MQSGGSHAHDGSSTDPNLKEVLGAPRHIKMKKTLKRIFVARPKSAMETSPPRIKNPNPNRASALQPSADPTAPASAQLIPSPGPSTPRPNTTPQYHACG